MNEQTLDSLASFNKLRFSPEERQDILDDFSQLFDALEVLENVDTTQTDPLIQTVPLSNIMREDAVVRMAPRQDILANASEHIQGCFVAPKVLD
ncbi:MAG: Asp-tRNA(Asn)/Glu-tRNA(Gln) amidotransferase subunit GatC [Peptococcaceae bacterium]|nr:Asp-tRNA(Asn)/Glu-tRNA(Gln) amidotransferase subunit GatC [Peptococcaceae bacterium]